MNQNPLIPKGERSGDVTAMIGIAVIVSIIIFAFVCAILGI